ncbi:MAG: SET domain-containing protein-lysine N-methyltransferase, partial [Bacteroidetes bacterium]|nr:SET domain-containing protein-lysine N-methyltransferase [Bacteroidota bacterium]
LQYPWDEENYGLCISGAGSFFNHSKDANAKIHDRDFDNNIQRYSAVRNIAKGEEVTIFYNEDFEEFINKVAT